MKQTISNRQRGGALVEMALFLPLLLVILTGVIDFSRAIQFDNIVIHISREGANLAKRAVNVKDAAGATRVINALTATAEPLNMNRDGMIYITEIVGTPSGQGRIVAQYRSGSGNRSLASRVWSCAGWRGDNSCNVAAGSFITLPAPLGPTDRIFSVETEYDYQMMTGYLFNRGPDLYAVTVL